MSSFSFVDDLDLRSNLDTTFAHIIDLLAISESQEYKNKPLLVSSLRKTIIIHTASIIEALLLWKLKKNITTQKIKLENEWKYFDIKKLHDLGNSGEVIAGKRKLEEKNLDKFDFNRITEYCFKYGVLTSDTLKNNIHKVRELRNKLHIGGLDGVEKEYTKSDLEFCFKTANEVKNIIKKHKN